LSDVVAAQTAEGLRKPEGGTGRGSGYPRLPWLVSRSRQKRGTWSCKRRRDEEPQERRTRAPVKAGEETAKAAREAHRGDSRGVEPRERVLLGRMLGNQLPRKGCPGGWPERERPRSLHPPRQAEGGTGREGAPEPVGVLRGREKYL
jgi:hypothetical protein